MSSLILGATTKARQAEELQPQPSECGPEPRKRFDTINTVLLVYYNHHTAHDTDCAFTFSPVKFFHLASVACVVVTQSLDS